MKELEERIKQAKHDINKLNCLLNEYTPFIKKCIINSNVFEIDFDDMLSISMITFVNCVKQYDETKGSFVSFTNVCIKNRLIDESRKQMRYLSKIVSIHPLNEETRVQTLEEKVSILEYNKEMERQALANEIDIFASELTSFGIRFTELVKICPKQDRSRNQCISLAKAIISDECMKSNFNDTHRLPQSELAKIFNISIKTIEKHRKYILAVTVLLMGDYINIQSFLPQYKEVL